MSENKPSKLERWSVILSGLSSVVGVIVGGIGIWIATSALDFTRKIEEARLTPIVVFQSSKTEERSIKIVNLNTAPAYIKSFEIKNDAGDYTSLEDWTYWPAIKLLGFENYKKDYDPSSNIYTAWLEEGTYMGPNEVYDIFREKSFFSKADDIQAEFDKRFDDLKKSKAIKVEFCNLLKENCKTIIYGE